MMWHRFASVVLFLTFVRMSYASNFYVSTTGNDVTGNGSLTNPWATIAHADRSGVLRPGDTVHVAPGKYTGSFQTYTSGTAAAPITYISDIKWGATLVGTSGSTWGNRANYIRIINFEVVGSDHGENGVYTEGSNTFIMGNKVHGVLPSTCNSEGGAGINLNGPKAQVIANLIYNNGPIPCNFVHGIYFNQPGGVATANIAFKNGGHGIQLWGCASNELIYNNSLFNNYTGAIVVGADCANPKNQINDYTVVDNNICVNDTRGIMEEGEYSISGHTVPATGPHNVYHDNLVYGNSIAEISVQTGMASGTINADPHFVNYTGDLTGNYHLSPGSPAIHAGVSGDITLGGRVDFKAYSFDGRMGLQGCCFDLGAYQFN
jgi:parallel beta-helix repeat protein